MQFVAEIRTLSCTFILGHHLTHLTKAIGFVFLTEKAALPHKVHRTWVRSSIRLA
jgi:hypothetical protein